jgi:hypothetical protein
MKLYRLECTREIVTCMGISILRVGLMGMERQLKMCLALLWGSFQPERLSGCRIWRLRRGTGICSTLDTCYMSQTLIVRCRVVGQDPQNL